MVSPRKPLIWLTLLALGASGCESTDTTAPYWQGRGWGAFALAQSSGAVVVAPSFKCETCEDKGEIPNRDTGRVIPCPDCSKALSPPPSAEPQGTAKGQEAPAVEVKVKAENVILSPEDEARLDEIIESLAPIKWQTDPTEAMNLAYRTGRKVCVILSSSERGCPRCEALLAAIGPTFDEKYGDDWVLCPLKKPDAWLKSWGITSIPFAWLVEPVQEGDTFNQKDLAKQTADAATLAQLLEKNR